MLLDMNLNETSRSEGSSILIVVNDIFHKKAIHIGNYVVVNSYIIPKLKTSRE